jgi:uncharacterized lipoprotein YddW (UPF0748 family)
LKLLYKYLIFSLLALSISSCQSQNSAESYHNFPISHPKREFRGVWLVTLDNKDFPSKPGLSTQEQKKELIEILDFLQKRGINAIFFQVRPSGDAFYASKLEPWSEWLTGKQGQAPQPFYDPLAFLVAECHQRNMELHAWFNPFRASYHHEKSDVSANQWLKYRPHWFIDYDNKMHFNPGVPEVRQHILAVIMDVVRRYDIDGVHFDDYFYPYRKGNQEFPDDVTFQIYRRGFKNLNDWRRDNINLFIQATRDSIYASKPHVKFGISPLGVWRNQSEDARGSATFVGQSSYDHLGADAIKWLQEGWIDYIAPQLYWSIGHKRADYQILSRWWSENNFDRHLYIGQAFYKIEDHEGDQNWRKPSEFMNQMRINRSLHTIGGSIFFRTKSLMNNAKAMSDTLHQTFYKYPTLIPTMPWKDNTPPQMPQNVRSLRSPKRILLKWDMPEVAKDGQNAYYFVIYRFKPTEKVDISQSNRIIAIQKDRNFFEKIAKDAHYTYVITAVDRLHNESSAAQIEVVPEEK